MPPASAKAASARATSPRRGSTAAKPCMVESSIGQIAPKPITPSAIAGVKPKIAIATGMTAEAGRGRRNSSVGPT